jgi:hypothetical protein
MSPVGAPCPGFGKGCACDDCTFPVASAPNPVGLHPEQRSVTFEISDRVIEELLDKWSQPVRARIVYHADTDTYDFEFKTARTGRIVHGDAE